MSHVGEEEEEEMKRLWRETEGRTRGPDDLLTMVLVRWQYVALVRFTRLLMAVMDRREESLFSEVTEVEYDHERSVSFHRYYGDLLHNASTEKSVEGRSYYRSHLRGCFLVAFLHDLGVQRFLMAHHTVLRRALLPCIPTPRAKANAYMIAIAENVGAFLSRSLSLVPMSEACIALWREEYMFHTFPEPAPHYPNSQHTTH
jgi:hypothetical protein